MARLLEALARLAQSWWRAGRIRVSPTEGRLLGLVPPCYLQIEGATLEITARRAAKQGLGVIYDCICPEGRGELRVTFAGWQRPPVIRWVSAGKVCELSTADIQIFEE
jgi:hypothetical protein